MTPVHRRLLLIWVVLAFAVTGCHSSTQMTGPHIGRVTFHTGHGAVRTDVVEIADSAEERAQGLMHRSSLNENSGMLFVFAEPTTASFWMKDTEIPLSIGFIDGNDRIVDLVDMQPCTGSPCPLYGSTDAYTRALEMNQGWFQEHGITIGDGVDVAIATG